MRWRAQLGNVVPRVRGGVEKRDHITTQFARLLLSMHWLFGKEAVEYRKRSQIVCTQPYLRSKYCVLLRALLASLLLFLLHTSLIIFSRLILSILSLFILFDFNYIFFSIYN